MWDYQQPASQFVTPWQVLAPAARGAPESDTGEEEVRGSYQQTQGQIIPEGVLSLTPPNGVGPFSVNSEPFATSESLSCVHSLIPGALAFLTAFGPQIKVK